MRLRRCRGSEERERDAPGGRLLVSPVSGEDRYGHLEHMPLPAGRLLAEGFERARRNANMKREIFYQGVKPNLVKENRRG